MATELVQKFSECFWFWHPEAKVRYEDDARLVVEHFAGKRGLKNSTRPCSVGLFKRAKKSGFGRRLFSQVAEGDFHGIAGNMDQAVERLVQFEDQKNRTGDRDG